MAFSKVSDLSQPDTLNLPFVCAKRPLAVEMQGEEALGGRWNLLVTSMVSFLPPFSCVGALTGPAPPTAAIHRGLQWERPGTPHFGSAPHNEPLWLS